MRIIKALRSRLGLQLSRTTSASPIDAYLANGRKPWSVGYWEYRNNIIQLALQDSDLVHRFQSGLELHPQYGIRLDERVVEYPWILSRLADAPSRLLDAGSTLNLQFLLELPKLAQKNILIYTLAPEAVQVPRANISYFYGDLRNTIIKDEVIDEVVCISTLEHIGLDNTRLYTQNSRYQEAKLLDFHLALDEFRRVLIPEGRLFITVPYGKYQNFGWLQQFDRALLEKAIDAFGGRVESMSFYKYELEGWRLADADCCKDCEYFDIHHASDYAPDYAAAARAVACVELVK